ncbi:MAG: anthranilate phosphoribosyltransferase [Firmicutes bacterium]|nr:anthranilate phosphoribosyltransferase [Bacillota bacterium]
MIKEAIARVVQGVNLTEEEAETAMMDIMDGVATPSQVAAFLTALRMKGETVEEITGSARAMRKKAARIYPEKDVVVDTCGTGGDGMNTFNISTTAAFVVAGAGAVVAKHGNRSVSSRSGSADVLEALGVNIAATPQVVQDCLNTVGMGFLFAPLFHEAMKHAAAPRREMGIRTVFNLLGPLTNPAGAQAQVLGVFDPQLTELLGEVLKKLGTRRAFVVHSGDGLDEFSVSAPTKVTEVYEDRVRTYFVTPEELGLNRASLEDMRGGSAQENASIAMEILSGARGPRRDVVLLNAAAALVAGGLAADLREGLGIATESIDSRKALEKLELLRYRTRGVPNDHR